MNVLALAEAAARLRTDHDILLTNVRAQPDISITAGPLGDFCESLHDLVAGVLAQARSGRTHWSLDERCETAEIGRRLNRGGVLAGREVPSDLLLHRYGAVRFWPSSRGATTRRGRPASARSPSGSARCPANRPTGTPRCTSRPYPATCRH